MAFRALVHEYGFGWVPSLEVEGIAVKDSSLRVELVRVSADDEVSLGQIIRLGDISRRTLGFLPQVVFRQAAESGTLIAAVYDGHVCGYARYSLPKQVVRLSHLCVGEDSRGRGIARDLVDAISERHSDRLGVALKCRPDYPANDLWPHLGFVAPGQGSRT